MKKQAIFIVALITLFFASAYIMANYGIKQEENSHVNVIEVSKKDTISNETINVNTQEEKTTPNTTLTLKKYYADCGHWITTSAKIPSEMVNFTQSELISKYPTWNLEKFSKEEIILTRETDSFCGEHYLVTCENGKIVIYSLDEEGNKTLLENTEIAYDYLPETDKIILNNGIYVYGKDELNKIKEDFES